MTDCSGDPGRLFVRIRERSSLRLLATRLDDELLETSSGRAGIAPARQTAEDVAEFVGGESFRASAFNEKLDRSIACAAHPDAILPARVPNRVAATLRGVVGSANTLIRLGVRNDERVILQYPYIA